MLHHHRTGDDVIVLVADSDYHILLSSVSKNEVWVLTTESA